MNNKKQDFQLEKGYTYIPNKIFEKTYERGIFNASESIIFYLISGECWGIDENNERLREWTKPLSIEKMVENTCLNKAQVLRAIKSLTNRNILLCRNDCYKFNENVNEWLKKERKKK